MRRLIKVVQQIIKITCFDSSSHLLSASGQRKASKLDVSLKKKDQLSSLVTLGRYIAIILTSTFLKFMDVKKKISNLISSLYQAASASDWV